MLLQWFHWAADDGKFEKMKAKNTRKTTAFINLALLFVVLFFLNILVNSNLGGLRRYSYLDLTEDKRYSLTDGTNTILEKMVDRIENSNEGTEGDFEQGGIFIQVLLEGDFPANFKRLQESTRELLDEFRLKTGVIEYAFMDVNDGTPEEKVERFEYFKNLGVTPTSFRVNEVSGTSERMIFPWAILRYGGMTTKVNLLEEQGSDNADATLNKSINLLEFKFAQAIRKLYENRRKVVAFTSGHGELTELQTQDLRRTIRPNYDHGTISLAESTYIPKEIDLLVVAKPVAPFTEREKFQIDQYVMNGGKVIWMIDKVAASLDSIQFSETQNSYVPRTYETGLDDLFFRYGIRFEPSLIRDLQCSKIPLQTGMSGGRPQFELFDWYYHTLGSANTEHPMVKSLDQVNFMFPGRIDTTIQTKTNLKKTVLISSSQNSNEQFIPMRLSYDAVMYGQDVNLFKGGPYPLAVLVEGEFPSLYENRITEEMRSGLASIGQEFLTRSDANGKMIFISDGDVAGNIVSDAENGRVFPLGFNRYEQRQYANKEFLVNAIEYMMDDDGLIESRGKEIKLRLLNTKKTRNETVYWQLINLLLPILFICIVGLGFYFWRRFSFSK